MRKIAGHEQVVRVAAEMAHNLYAECMKCDNGLYARWKEQCGDLTPVKAERLFVQLMLPKLLEPARTMLAKMLGEKRFAHLHESIYDSIILDNEVRASRLVPEGRPHIHVDAEGQVTTRYKR